MCYMGNLFRGEISENPLGDGINLLKDIFLINFYVLYRSLNCACVSVKIYLQYSKLIKDIFLNVCVCVCDGTLFGRG